MRASSFLTIVLGLVLVTLAGQCYGQLKVGFYHGKCGEKDVENVIYEVVKQKISSDPDTVSDLVRLSFHDCFVRGCDGSILLTGKDVEQTAPINVRLGGIKAVNDLKAAVEKACPGVVSCADTLVIGARAAIALAGGKWFDVETGRRDGRVSLRSEAQANIPPPTMPIPTAIKLFASKGLNKNDFVILLGGHTVGTAHCHSFKERLYNFRNTNKPDPSISSSLLQLLRQTCPLNSNVDNETFLDQTPNSHFKIDNAYYKQILAHNGTMEIDQNLASSSLTRGMVQGLAYSRTQFLDQFGPAMVKMARIGVLTGYQGEIRKTCGSVN
ncbi:peroxidase 57-like [Silene latifolia]|uniref:peroxidase 57-like n=1 Tax=Silene latifolia TaxID=37657 RepID=UPI003D76FA49